MDPEKQQMIAVLLMALPLAGGLLAFALPQGKAAKNLSWVVAGLVLALAATLCLQPGTTQFQASWLPALGAQFSLELNGLSKILVLLTALAFPLVLGSTPNPSHQPGAYQALMLLTQAGLMGVFMASDALLFYFCWELALIPVYFLCSIWGGEKRIAVTFKFFIYTFVGSLLLLVGILYVYFQQAQPSFSWQAFHAVSLSAKEQAMVFWLFFLAFAIKMPIFPLHTWQPDAYEQSPTGVTMILSGVMVKMGLYAVIRWLLPLFPEASHQFASLIAWTAVAGMLYASLIAIRQDDFKRLIAYSSIAHIGLMAAGLFVHQAVALQGVVLQLFAHGINVIGLWIMADRVERQLGTRQLSALGGLAQKAPTMAIFLVVLSLANIALPLTNAFVGEFLMFNGLFRYNMWMAAVGGISIILAAVYTLNMVQKIIFGQTNALTESAQDLDAPQALLLALLVAVILLTGVYPQPLIQLTQDTVQTLFAQR